MCVELSWYEAFFMSIGTFVCVGLVLLFLSWVTCFLFDRLYSKAETIKLAIEFARHREQFKRWKDQGGGQL